MLAQLSNAVVVGHKLDFEEKHLVAEFDRLGVRLEGIPGLCSLIFARHQFDRFTYRQSDLVSLITGEWPPAQHTALGDSRALAHLLSVVLADAPQRLWWWGPDPVALAPVPHTRYLSPRAGGFRAGGDGWLATLTARLPMMTNPPATRPDGLPQYRALLARALADRTIVVQEAEQLALVAARAGLTQITARQVHKEFLIDARVRAAADGVVTQGELRELQQAAGSLPAAYLISDLEEAAAADRARVNGPLKDWRILPIDDEAPGMVDVMDYAVAHGAKVAANLTKTTRLVIGPDGRRTTDPRIERAHAAHVPVVDVEQARQILTEEIESGSADQSLFDRAEGEAVQPAAAREALNGAPEWHEFWRPHELTPPEYGKRFTTL